MNLLFLKYDWFVEELADFLLKLKIYQNYSPEINLFILTTSEDKYFELTSSGQITPIFSSYLRDNLKIPNNIDTVVYNICFKKLNLWGNVSIFSDIIERCSNKKLILLSDNLGLEDSFYKSIRRVQEDETLNREGFVFKFSDNFHYIKTLVFNAKYDKVLKINNEKDIIFLTTKHSLYEQFLYFITQDIFNQLIVTDGYSTMDNVIKLIKRFYGSFNEVIQLSEKLDIKPNNKRLDELLYILNIENIYSMI